MEWRKFYLTPGQQSPEGSQGWCVPDGGIAWYGENFPEGIQSEPMSEEEIRLPEVNETKNKLAEIDIASVRSIREWVSNQVDAPEYLKNYEKQAVEYRKRIK